MLNVFKITLGQQLNYLTPAFIKAALFTGVYFYLFGFTIPYSYIGVLYVYLFLLVTDILPALIVHIQYLMKKGVLSIDRSSKMISYQSAEKNLKYTFEDIISVEHIASYGGGSWWYSFGDYRYFKIIFKKGGELIITCLMVDDFKSTLEGLLHVQAKKKLRIIAFVL